MIKVRTICWSVKDSDEGVETSKETLLRTRTIPLARDASSYLIHSFPRNTDSWLSRNLVWFRYRSHASSLVGRETSESVLYSKSSYKWNSRLRHRGVQATNCFKKHFFLTNGAIRTVTVSEGTKSSPWQGRINSGASDASVILFIFSNFVCGAYRDQPCAPCTVTVWKLSANEVAIASDGVGMRIIYCFK